MFYRSNFWCINTLKKFMMEITFTSQKVKERDAGVMLENKGVIK
jgi:hypothetical protein